MSDKAKMHQIWFRLGVRHFIAPQVFKLDLRGLLLREGRKGEGGREKKKEREGGERVGVGKERELRGREKEEKGNLPPVKFRSGYATGDNRRCISVPHLICWRSERNRRFCGVSLISARDTKHQLANNDEYIIFMLLSSSHLHGTKNNNGLTQHRNMLRSVNPRHWHRNVFSCFSRRGKCL